MLRYHSLNTATCFVTSSQLQPVLYDLQTVIKLIPIYSISFAGGKSGVFEIEDLVELLKRENSRDIFVATVPQDIRYVDYICIVSARSKRHIQALAEFVRKVYKKKRCQSDLIPRIEGKDSGQWVALDLGNIIFH